MWSTGKKPIPPLRHVALLYLVTRLTGIVGSWIPVHSRYARRSELARQHAVAWLALASSELTEDLGVHSIPDERPDLARAGFELGARMLAKLEAADAS
jgi:hypothetical protein